MSSNGPPRNYSGALEVNLKACAKRTKWRVYNIIGFVFVILLGILFKDKILKKNLVCRATLVTKIKKFNKHMDIIGRININPQQ